ncbi:MAG TPA: murein biosynthesis integral membrane protein MurJ [Ktedonobacteraceae bacterium]|nr:murein biosynthesis integral membrane protein MurJ [Ktedonobacteraceae bacterium]
MENFDQQQWKQPSFYDTGTSLSYRQSSEYAYLEPTLPIQRPLSLQEQRLRQLREGREQRQRRTVPLKRSGELSCGLVELSQQGPPRRISIGKAALLISASLTASRFLGLLQKALFTAVFRPSAVTDAFNQASLVPDLIFNIVAGGALMSAFIPVFNAYMLEQKESQEGWHVANAALSLVMSGMVLLAGIAMIFAPQIVWPYNYNVSPQQLTFIATLTRIMLLQSVIMGSGVIVTSVLNARQHFFLPALGTLLYPVGAIIGLFPGLVLVLLHHPNDVLAVYCATAGVVLGALFMVGVQVPGLVRVGMDFRFTLDWRHPGIRQMVRQMLPRLANTLMLNFSTAIDRILLSFLVIAVGSAGFTTVYMLAFAVVSIPLSLVMALGTATFPTMSEYAVTGQMERFVAIVLEALRSILFVSIPCAVGLLILNLSIVQIMFEHGSFTLLYAELTAVPLLGFALGLPGNAAIEILTRAFYALRNSKTPVLISIWQFLLKIVLSLLLLDPIVWCAEHGLGNWASGVLTRPLQVGAWGMAALSLATSIAVLAEAGILLWLLHQQLGGLHLRALALFVVRVGIATLALALALLLSRWLLDMLFVTASTNAEQSLGVSGIVLVLLKLVLSVCIGGFVYVRAARFLHILNAEQLGPVNRLLVRLHLSRV